MACLGLLLSTLVVLFAYALPAHAQGGPPFRTDDPDTPGNRNWEINFGFVGQRNPANGAYQVPDIDINYGLGDRIQLKYEIAPTLEETRPQPATASSPAVSETVIGAIGDSYPGIKWRFYEHKKSAPLFKDAFGTGLLGLFGHHAADQNIPNDPSAAPPESNFSISTYPQLYLSNPTNAISRGVVAPGPDLLLPVEFNTRLGPIRVDGEVGYYFGNHQVAQSWIRGLLLGHEFSDRTEAYAEIYDQQDANRPAPNQGVGAFATGIPKQRQATLGAGGRQALNHAKTINLLLMGGRSFQKITAANSQPSWIAYVGVQVLFGPKSPETPQVEDKLPNESKP